MNISTTNPATNTFQEWRHECNLLLTMQLAREYTKLESPVVVMGQEPYPPGTKACLARLETSLVKHGLDPVFASSLSFNS